METEHEFTLILGGISELTPEIFDALFEAGCDDATMSSRDGIVWLDFRRTESSPEKALASAVRDVRKANIGAGVLLVGRYPCEGMG